MYWGTPQAFLVAVNLHKKPVANVCKFCQIWSHPKRKFTRFRQVSTDRQGFSARFSTALTVFQKLVAINAISFWGWSPLALHHQNICKKLMLSNKTRGFIVHAGSPQSPVPSIGYFAQRKCFFGELGRGQLKQRLHDSYPVDWYILHLLVWWSWFSLRLFTFASTCLVLLWMDFHPWIYIYINTHTGFLVRGLLL